MSSAAVMNAVKSLIESTVPSTRVVTRSWLDIDQRNQSDLRNGVYTVMSQAERDYANYRGREGELGTHTILVSAQFLLAENATGEQVEDAEFAMLDELKLVAKSASKPALIGALELVGIQQSGQLEAPYGWVLARFENVGGHVE